MADLAIAARGYELVRLLGEGGMGRVYEAVHLATGKVVAIKMVRATTDPHALRSILNEAAAAAQLSHANIVELLDLGRDERGATFLVMEYVAGADLEQWLVERPAPGLVCSVICEVLDALAAAHAQGIVHRDLKPGNVLLTPDGRVKLSDFGVARVADPLRVEGRDTGVQGTPFYMAPEQVLDTDLIGPSTDLYAVGVMLYEVLGATSPFDPTAPFADVLRQKLLGVEPFRLHPSMEGPPELADLVMSLLAPNPKLRPRFAARVKRALEAIAPRMHQWMQPPRSDAVGALAPTLRLADRSERRVLGSTAGEGSSVMHWLRSLPLVGRDAQIERVRGLVDDVIAGRGARVMVVSGRAGEGKTRLVRQTFAEVEGLGLMVGAAARYDEVFSREAMGLRACVDRLLGPLEAGSSVDDALEGRWRWLTAVPQPGVDFRKLHAWLSSTAAVPTELVAELAAMGIAAASRLEPIFLWLDDVAWSTDGACALVEQLLASSARVLVACTMRSGTAEHPTTAAWLRRIQAGGARLEELPPLSCDERAELVEMAGPVEHDVAAAVAAALDEPALVIVEAVRSWIDDGLLVAKDGLYMADRTEIAELAARSRGGAVLTRRVETFIAGFAPGVDAERVLCHAALLGASFDEQVLRQCVASDVDDFLDRALLTGLIRVAGPMAYRFEHQLFVDAALERLPERGDAAEILRKTAEALVTHFGSYHSDTSLAAAVLYRRGGDHDAAVRLAANAILGITRANALERADAAIALVAGWLEEDRVPEVHVHRALLSRAIASRHLFALEYGEARKHYEAACRMARLVGDGELEMLAASGLASSHFYLDDLRGAERVARQLLANPAHTFAGRRAHHVLCNLVSLRGDLASAIDHVRAAIECNTERVLLAPSHIALSELLSLSADASAADAFDEMERLVSSTHERSLIDEVERARAVLCLTRGQWSQAKASALAHLSSVLLHQDRWTETCVRAIVATCDAAESSDEVAARSVNDFIDAYARVHHDELVTWWCIRATEALLRGRAMHALAAQLGAMLDARQREIAACFDRDPGDGSAQARGLMD